MSQVGPSHKNEFWQDIVLPPSGATPGTYMTPVVTVNDGGIITNIEEGSFFVRVVNNEAALSGLPIVDGGIAVVVDAGAGRPEFYVYMMTPSPGWVQMTFGKGIGSLQIDFDYLSVFPLLIGRIPPGRYIKRVILSIRTAFTAGTTFRVASNAGDIVFPTSAANVIVVDDYEYTTLGNNTALTGSNNEFWLQLASGSPVAGAGTVFIEFS